MGSVPLYDYQHKAVCKLRDGNILCGGVGSGKSRTAIAYYYKEQGGYFDEDYYTYSAAVDDEYTPMDDSKVQDLYIITTAKKRDSKDWEKEMIPFLIGPNDIYHHKVVIDSWNNIKKYKDVEDAFFIFDEQRVIGYGAWTKSFLTICQKNRWILLSATPGDTWSDYIPVFIANGFYRNKTEFNRRHVIFSRYTKYPKIERYVDVSDLIRYRRKILVNMDYKNRTNLHHYDIWTDYDPWGYKNITRNRWNYTKNKPIETASEYCYELRRAVNTDISRQIECLNIFAKQKKVIIFYNFDYERDILLGIDWQQMLVGDETFGIAEWSGHSHQEIPNTETWVYLVQYLAGAEGWNCIETNTIIFYSQNYSYKVMVQASGRIDRLNTPYEDLYFYHLKSHASIDLAIASALKKKKKFNENKFVKG